MIVPQKLYPTEICVDLCSEKPCSVLDLYAVFENRGFDIRDDPFVAEIPRHDTIEPWQTETICAFKPRLQDVSFHEIDFDETWDSIRISYIICALPEETRDIFLKELESVSEKFLLKPFFSGEVSSIEEIKKSVDHLHSLYRSELAPAGSHSLYDLLDNFGYSEPISRWSMYYRGDDRL